MYRECAKGLNIVKTLLIVTLYDVLNAQVTVFQHANYLENFVQSTFDALPAESLSGMSENSHVESP